MIEPCDPVRTSAPSDFGLPGRLSIRVGDSVAGATKAPIALDRVTGLRAAWVEMLARYEWCWFATFTFTEDVHPESADKSFRSWMSRVNESYLGSHWRRPSKASKVATWVRGLEWQKRGVLHYHALVGKLPREYVAHDTRAAWAVEWADTSKLTGYARIDQCNGRDEVYSYLTKYVVKGGEIDLSVSLRLAIPSLALY